MMVHIWYCSDQCILHYIGWRKLLDIKLCIMYQSHSMNKWIVTTNEARSTDLSKTIIAIAPFSVIHTDNRCVDVLLLSMLSRKLYARRKNRRLINCLQNYDPLKLLACQCNLLLVVMQLTLFLVSNCHKTLYDRQSSGHSHCVKALVLVYLEFEQCCGSLIQTCVHLNSACKF
jgi:hypothetical protein